MLPPSHFHFSRLAKIKNEDEFQHKIFKSPDLNIGLERAKNTLICMLELVLVLQALNKDGNSDDFFS